MKKILSMVLTLSIVLGTIGVPVFAEEVTASAKIGGESYATLSDALSKASSMSDEVVVKIYDKVTLDESLSGNYTSIKFVGKDTDAEIYLDVQGYITAPGKTVAFEDLKLSKSEGGFVTNAGFMNLAFGVYDVSSVSYKNCDFLNGAYASSGKVTFTNCTFYRSYDRYGLWAYGDVDCTVDGCTFADFRGIKMYAEGLEKTVELTVKNTDFSAVNNKPAIVLTCGESVTLENNTYSNTGVFELDLDGAPNGTPVQSDVAPTCVNDKGACGVLVDGKIYTTVEQAAEAATSGSTVTLLHNSAETVELPEGVKLDKNGFEAANVTTPSGTTEVTGNVTYAYVSTNANTPIWGEGGGNASESLEFKLYEGEKEIAVTELNNVGGIIDGDVYVTWNFFVENTDNYWTTEWAEGYPKASMQPDTVKVFVDGVEAGSNAVKLNAPDDLNKIVAAAEDENGFIGYFTTPADAIKAAAPAGTVELLTDVTVDEWVMFAESLSISNSQLITLVIDGMTINGNGNTLTVNSIESANNGARLFYDATSLNINDLTIKCADGVSGGIGLKSGIIKGVTFEGGVYGVLPGEGDVTIEGCTFNTNGTSIYFEDERDNLVVTGNTFNNANDANVILLRGDVQFTNNVVNSGRTVNIVSGSPVVAGNDFNDVRLKVYPTATATVYNNEINNLVFEDAKNETTSIFTDNTLSETAQAALDAVTAKTTGLSGSGTEEDPYLINNLAELEWFRDKVDEQAADGSTQFAGKYFKLTDDIDLLGINWNPIGSMTGDHGSFKGVFDGDGHTISNLSIDVSDSKGIGFFAYTKNSAEIKNLTFNNININAVGKTHVGGVVGDAFANTKITNVHITGSVNIKAKAYIGAIVGHGYVVVDNSSVKAEGTIDGSMWCVGGIVGYAGEGTTNVMNSSVEGIGNGLIIQSAAGGLGSIVGMAEDNNGTQPISGSNLFAKNIDIKTYVGGYGTAYADYALGYLYGGNPTSKLTGELRVENVIFETSTGETTPKVADAIASIGSNVYFNFLSAIAAAADGETITLLSDATPVLTSQREITKASTIDLNGNTLTLKEDDLYFGTTTFKNGTIIVDPSVKPSTAVFWMFANQSLTFDNVKVVASGVTGTYLIGLDGNNSDLNIINGSEIIIENDTALDLDVICVNASTGNDILIENSKINVKNLDGRVLFRGNYTISGNSELYLDGITKAGIRIEAGQILAINDNASVTITGEPRDGGIHLTDATAGYTKADTATVNATINKPWDGVTISNLAELKMFRDAVNNGDTYKGKTVTLTVDIDLANENWTPIGSPEKLFLGTFDGGNHTISNLVIEGGSNSNQGFFGVTQEGEIKNLTINNAKVTGRLNVGVLAGTPYTSKYTNIKLTGHVEVNGFAYVGGVGGKNAYANWTDITVAVDGTSYVKAVSTENGKAYRTYVGGVIGFMGEGGHKVSNVTSNINVFGDVCDIGGIAGIAHYGNTFENCKATGKVECENAEETEVGGIAGVWHNEKGYTVTFTNCKYEGSSAVSAVGAPYLTSQTSSETSGTLLIDGVQAWPVTGVAQIGSTKYKSISEALEAATNGETVTLLGDVEVSESLVVAKGSVIAIDLNGFTISRNQTEKATGNDQLIQNNGTLTIKDSSEAETGKLVYNYTGESVNNVSLSTVSNNCATLIVESGTIENASDATGRSAAGTYMYAVDSLTNSNLGEASVTVNGGVIKSNYMAIRQFVNSTTDRNALVVTDGEIIAEKRAINVQGSNNETKASNAAELNISGGIIKVTSDESSYSVCNLTKSENVAITGGTFIGAIWSSRDNVISGGTFNVEPDAVYAADGYEFVANEDGTYGVQEVSEKTVVISFFNLGLGNDLSMNFYVDETTIEEDSYVLFTKSNADTTALKTKKILASEAASSEGYYKFTFDGLAAKEMGDEVSIVFYNNEGEAISEERIITFKDLCMRTFESNNDSLNTLLVDMLNYGAYTQEHFNYNIDALVNSDLTEEQKAYGSTEFEYSERKTSSLNGKTTSISLELENNIQLNLYFTGINKGMYGTISYMPHDGLTEVIKNVTYNDFEKKGDYYKLSADSLVVADYQQLVTFTIYNEDGSVYEIAKARMEDYGIGGSDMLSDRIMMFAKSAYNYLHR